MTRRIRPPDRYPSYLDTTRPTWNAHALALGSEPRPSAHPILRGPEKAEARAALEAAFGPVVELREFGGELLGGPGALATKEDLVFIVSGLVRQVLDDAGDDAVWWGRGQDVLTTDIFGAGCFVNLARCARPWMPEALQGALDGAPQMYDDRGGLLPQREREQPELQYFSSPLLRADGAGVGPLRVRVLRRQALEALLDLGEDEAIWSEAFALDLAYEAPDGRRGRATRPRTRRLGGPSGRRPAPSRARASAPSPSTTGSSPWAGTPAT